MQARLPSIIHLGGISFRLHILTQNVNSLIGILLVLAKRPIVLEEKSPDPLSINLMLQESDVWKHSGGAIGRSESAMQEA